MPGTLFLVPTPIGNLEDITLRALRVLKEVALVACEDTRTSRILMQHYDITTPLTSYHEHNKLAKLDALFAALETGDVALISDAGTPGLSDPGYELVREAASRGYRVEALPGPNALLPALTASGLPTDTFIFLGFLPRKGLRELFGALAHVRRTLAAYESPNRLVETLTAARESLGADRPCCVAREVSKKFEEFTRGTVDEVLRRYQTDAPRGEIVVLFGPAPEPSAWDEARVRDALRARLAAGDSRSAAAKAVAAESGWKRSTVYDIDLED
ncbi:MAG: 16S rRNA (cytidine(1402)-2'-O)-methyltransferase [Anaerolineae bacterium]|jgi:16S rRNA (cytidine1402-2'-O)-methyltransferase|nr:16S rRNA (cytidine(1402)-2'-O)-methyltransferase [Anaerolineae bacterium]